jgi:Ca2+-binding EF-hand superfamily protein
VLTLQGFTGLWQYLCQWHGIFLNFDADRSGNISISELQNALDCFGFRLPPRLIQLMIHKQRLSQGKIQKGRQLSDEVDFPAFIDLCVTVKQATDMFTRLDTNRSGSVQLYWENYMDLIVGGK